MKYSILFLALVVHAAVALGGFVGLEAWAVGALDSGNTDPGLLLGTARLLVHYVLLQPLAHWVLGTVAWWTWSGMIGAGAVVAVNSLIQVGGVALLWRRLEARRVPDHD